VGLDVVDAREQAGQHATHERVAVRQRAEERAEERRVQAVLGDRLKCGAPVAVLVALTRQPAVDEHRQQALDVARSHGTHRIDVGL